MQVPPVPESGSDQIDTVAIQLAVVFEAAGNMPAFAADKVD
jgi:hypothetical protein